MFFSIILNERITAALSRISVCPELFWCDTLMPLKAFYQMAAIRKAGFLTGIIKVKIGEKHKLFRLVKPHSFYILLAAHSVLLTEFGQ